MIALLAAVPQETKLLRAALQNSSEENAQGLDSICGQICGVDICLVHSGIGKAAAATAAMTTINHCKPEALWVFGCGGAYPESGLEISDIAIASEEIFGDEGVETTHGFEDLSTMGFAMREAGAPLFNRWPVDQALHEWARSVVPELRPGPFVTVSTCTGTMAKAVEIVTRTKGICENMEGAAAALACAQLSIPMLEIRGISNRVENRDTSRWDLPAGMSAAQDAVIKLLTRWQERKDG